MGQVLIIKPTPFVFYSLIHSMSFHLLHWPNHANDTYTTSIPSCLLKWPLIGGVGKLLTREGWREIISTNELFCKLLQFGFSSVRLFTDPDNIRN